jgi:hypothetical protein
MSAKTLSKENEEKKKMKRDARGTSNPPGRLREKNARRQE